MEVSNDAELATMFAKHNEKDKFNVRLQIGVVVLEVSNDARVTGSSSWT